MTDPRLEHLDPATIAALVDQTLDPAARAAAHAHLAACADCREVWVETSEIDNEMRGATTSEPSRDVTVVARPASKRSWIYGGMGLAAAAAVLLAVFLPRMMDRGDRPELQELVAAVGENRRTEARLTGGFKWGPVPGVTRGGDESRSAAVDLAVAHVMRDRPKTNDPTVIAATGVGALVTGDPLNAIDELTIAVRLDETRAAVWSDLSAAHLENARMSGATDSLAEALRAADRALALNPVLPEALFNRALALGGLNRPVEEREAWDRYLMVDRNGAWAAEAQRRRDAARPHRE